MNDKDHIRILNHIEKHGIKYKDTKSTRDRIDWKGGAHRTIDLHGRTLEEAIFDLKNEFESSGMIQNTIITVIVGKGKSTQNRAVLKPGIQRWLKTGGKKYVRAIRELKDNKGEVGSIDVLLK